jgi:hypothetical protein
VKKNPLDARADVAVRPLRRRKRRALGKAGSTPCFFEATSAALRARRRAAGKRVRLAGTTRTPREARARRARGDWAGAGATASRLGGDADTFVVDALHVAGKENASSATKRETRRGAGVGRRSTDGRRTARARGKRGGDVPVRNARAISRHRSSARSNGRNNLPRPDESDEAVVFFARTKSTFPTGLDSNSSQKTGENSRHGIFPPGRIRAPGRMHRYFRVITPNSENTLFVLAPVSSPGPHIRHRSRGETWELRKRPTRRADRTRGHVAGRDARPRDARARGPDSRGLGGGGGARCTAPGTVLPPLLPPRPTRRAPKRRRFMACRIRLERLTRPAPLTVPVPDRRRSNGGSPPDMSNGSGVHEGLYRVRRRNEDAGLLASPACRIRRNASIARAGSGFFLDAPRADPANAR